MKQFGIRSPFGYLAGMLALILFGSIALGDDKKPAKAPAKTPSSGAKPAAGGASKSSGAASTSHGPTTTSHGPTTTSHSPTTTGTHPSTSNPHPGTTAGTTKGGAGTGKGSGTANKGSGPAGKGSAPAAKGGAPKGPGGVTAKNTKTVQTASGKTVTTRPGGKIASFHDPKRGMDVHHGLNGNRRVVVERRDGSRIVAERGGRGFVERPYRFHGHDYARRSYYYHGRYYHAYYGRYYYRGAYMYPYYPSYYYGPAYYGWVYNPWVAPVSYAWGWGGNPWYGYYGAWFTPYPVYANASLWLTDYIIANSLMAAYQEQAAAQAQAAAMSGPAPLSPEAKQLIADEVKREVALEYDQAKAGGDPNPALTSIQRDLTDGGQHVFVAGQDLDVVDAGGNECALSEGDALQLINPTAPDATSASLNVLASKGGKECGKGDTVAVALQDLQEMQNHMRETIDQGMQDLQKKQGQGGLPAAPASARTAPVETPMAVEAPPPPPQDEVAAQINQQSQEADRAEQEAAGEAGGAAPAAATDASAAPPTIEPGQSIEDVTAAMGQPLHILGSGTKKIYLYKDLKITFVDGKVTDIQ